MGALHPRQSRHPTSSSKSSAMGGGCWDGWGGCCYKGTREGVGDVWATRKQGMGWVGWVGSATREQGTGRVGWGAATREQGKGWGMCGLQENKGWAGWHGWGLLQGKQGNKGRGGWDGWGLLQGNKGWGGGALY